jgi:hypothetical protein
MILGNYTKQHIGDDHCWVFEGWSSGLYPVIRIPIMVEYDLWIFMVYKLYKPTRIYSQYGTISYYFNSRWWTHHNILKSTAYEPSTGTCLSGDGDGEGVMDRGMEAYILSWPVLNGILLYYMILLFKTWGWYTSIFNQQSDKEPMGGCRDGRSRRNVWWVCY